ncbi:GNAT family N-acetyltransferase [Sphingobacterium sp. InxBP1]|uniref:GNAT family N-acetyltransferase n=1 Tax=Sphingobacterium sp. InxBP1 TaxID=2870328 RepID=UPI0022445767|nr:GNAT family N-acetyltransferase [Sphingobacterium sp. InxBP1]MCW8313484.1 GNAT family N-acetyltransferase [Sphingobacterium sp. InxBP1]
MKIRRYQPSDLQQISQLFYDTVHTVNARDYSPEQLDAWASGQLDLAAWNSSFLAHHTLVAIIDEQIAGFGDMTDVGYLDRLFVHKDYQGQGIATALCDALEHAVDTPRFTTHASITAKPFFESRGYRVVKEQQVIRRGVRLTNYVMEKNQGQ